MLLRIVRTKAINMFYHHGNSGDDDGDFGCVGGVAMPVRKALFCVTLKESLGRIRIFPNMFKLTR